MDKVIDRTQLKQFKHPHWGTTVGREADVRIAVLKEEVELWKERVGKQPDYIPYMGYIKQMLEGRVEELENARVDD